MNHSSTKDRLAHCTTKFPLADSLNSKPGNILKTHGLSLEELALSVAGNSSSESAVRSDTSDATNAAGALCG